MYNVALIACSDVDEASQALADIEQNSQDAHCSVAEYAVVRTDAQIAVVSNAVVDSDEDFDGLDGLVEAFVDAAADWCACDDADCEPDDVVVAAADVFEASDAALVMLLKAHRQADIDALLAPYGDAVTTWGAAEVRKALHEARREDREENRAERKLEHETDRAAREAAREERREARHEERLARKEEREIEREL